ncbi:MAG TPA: phosphatase PAP2 family protein [bacterium]|jgi:lipid A 4'-phosphatase|nr:phosphatase PAP2 family protein [bacterium]
MPQASQTALSRRPPFPFVPFYGGLILFAALTLLFRRTDLDLRAATYFFSGLGRPWPGQQWAWSEALYRWGQAPADLCGGLAWAAFLLSFTSPRLSAWRGPGLYLGLLLLLGPGLLCNVLGKGLAGRPRPLETLAFGGIWEFHRPFQLGVPGRGASFLSGHAANAWYFLGFVFLLSGRVRSPVLALVAALALAFGTAMSLARVSQGAHWPSDTLLCGAALWTLAAGLSPLIHWQPSASFWRRGPVLLALAGAALAWLSLSRVVYEERHFSGPAAPGQSTGPTHRDLPIPPRPDTNELDVDMSLVSGDLAVRFDSVPSQPLTLDEIFRGQGLPRAGEDMAASSFSAGGQFAPGPKALAVRFAQSLRGPWLASHESLRLGLASGLEVDARLRSGDGEINIGPFPPGRRVLLSGLPAGCAPPDGFHPFGATDWMRDGKAPLISLDLDAPVLRFDQP